MKKFLLKIIEEPFVVSFFLAGLLFIWVHLSIQSEISKTREILLNSNNKSDFLNQLIKTNYQNDEICKKALDFWITLEETKWTCKYYYLKILENKEIDEKLKIIKNEK